MKMATDKKKWAFVESCLISSYASGKRASCEHIVSGAVNMWNELQLAKVDAKNAAVLTDILGPPEESTENTPPATEIWSDGLEEYQVEI
jgi:hypothetical protein